MISKKICCGAFTYIIAVYCFLVPTSLYCSDNFTDLKNAQTETAEALAEIDKLHKLSGECRKKADNGWEGLSNYEKFSARLIYVKRELATRRHELKALSDHAKQYPGTKDGPISELKNKIGFLILEEKSLQSWLMDYVSRGNYTNVDTQVKELERLESECRELLEKYIYAKENVEQLRKRAETLEKIECDALYAKLNKAVNPDSPNYLEIAGIFKQATHCLWYVPLATMLYNEMQKQKKEEELDEDDSDDENEYFEEVGESEVGNTRDNSYDQSGNLCSSLLAKFNATYNIEQMEKILEKAQNCSWHGDGLAAMQNQKKYYKEQNQRRKGAGFQGNCEPTKSGKIGDPQKTRIENDHCPDHRYIAVWRDKSQAMDHWCQINRDGNYRQTHRCEKHCECQGKNPTSKYDKYRIK